ncbi:hypothetical protein BD410DRAFT_847096 [Rickenella mellea]|uniref:Uncharacterized protein n=1 Tax=Rickenella mellea TaxID=50990 RepID=A0A4Y7PDF6_9AGAM|nr:hypothetical protein BD410DRAFT_847096 [Rickenella mellea]
MSGSKERYPVKVCGGFVLFVSGWLYIRSAQTRSLDDSSIFLFFFCTDFFHVLLTAIPLINSLRMNT